jgi:hypothetical protein
MTVFGTKYIQLLQLVRFFVFYVSNVHHQETIVNLSRIRSLVVIDSRLRNTRTWCSPAYWRDFFFPLLGSKAGDGDLDDGKGLSWLIR